MAVAKRENHDSENFRDILFYTYAKRQQCTGAFLARGKLIFRARRVFSAGILTAFSANYAKLNRPGERGAGATLLHASRKYAKARICPGTYTHIRRLCRKTDMFSQTFIIRFDRKRAKRFVRP